MDNKKIPKLGLVIALYVALTIMFGSTSYGPIQIRWSAGLYVLASRKKDYIIPLGLGVAIANIYGGLGLQDIILGSLITIITCYIISKFKNKWIVMILIPVISAPLLSIYLTYIYSLPYLLLTFQIFIGQMIASFTVGYISFKIWERLNEVF